MKKLRRYLASIKFAILLGLLWGFIPPLKGQTLVSVTLAAPAGSTITPNGATQIVATCHYSDSTTTTCNSTDAHGNAVASWSDSNGAVATITLGGLVSGVANGTANFAATVTGGASSGPLGITVAATTLTLTSAALSTTGGVTQIAVGATNQIVATCTYSDSSTTNCTTTDIRGSAVNPSSWASSAPSSATISTSGLATGVAVGSAQFSATVSN
jgi:hypothetical protein